MQQFGRHRQIDLSSIEMGVAEPCGERRQQPLNIRALSVPGRQPVYGRGMAQGVKARSSPLVVAGLDSGRLKELGERGLDGTLGQGRTIAVGQEGRGRTLRQGAFRTLRGIGLQRTGKLRADGNEAGLVELGVANGQQRAGQVDIAECQSPSLAQPQTRAVEE